MAWLLSSIESGKKLHAATQGRGKNFLCCRRGIQCPVRLRPPCAARWPLTSRTWGHTGMPSASNLEASRFGSNSRCPAPKVNFSCLYWSKGTPVFSNAGQYLSFTAYLLVYRETCQRMLPNISSDTWLRRTTRHLLPRAMTCSLKARILQRRREVLTSLQTCKYLSSGAEVLQM